MLNVSELKSSKELAASLALIEYVSSRGVLDVIVKVEQG